MKSFPILAILLISTTLSSSCGAFNKPLDPNLQPSTHYEVPAMPDTPVVDFILRDDNGETIYCVDTEDLQDLFLREKTLIDYSNTLREMIEDINETE